METRKRGKSGIEVLAIGLGCMEISFGYRTASDKKEMGKLIQTAFEKGVTFFDTAEDYGPFENEKLGGEALAPIQREVGSI